jgi:hypothetical protein
VEGIANASNFVGQLNQYNVQIDWGDGNIDKDSYINFTQYNDNFNGTWHSDPDHTYSRVGSFTITVKLYHGQPPGKEGSGDVSVSITIQIARQIKVIADPAEASGGNFTVTYTKSGTRYTSIQRTPWVESVDDGSDVTISNPQSIINAGNTQYIFQTYNQSYSQSYNVTMNADKTIILVYKTQYLVTFNQTGSGVAPTVTYAIDGSASTTSIVPFSVWVDSGKQISYTYQANVSDGSGVRYVLTDVSPASPQIVTGSLTITGTYKIQYYLAVNSPYGDPTPRSDWFDAGTPITASVTSPWPVDAIDTRYVCTGWNGTGSVPASGTDTSVTFTIDEPSSITWNWKTQYYLTLATTPSGITTPSGAGWYDADTYASISTDEYVDTAPDTRYRFNGWTTEDRDEITIPSATSTAVLMDKTKTVTANYVVQYRVRVEWSGLGADASGKVVTVTVGGISSIKNASDPFFDAFIDTGKTVSYSYEDDVSSTMVGKRYKLDSVSGNSTAASHDFGAITGPITETGTYKTQYYFTVNSPYDSPTGQGWYDNGSTAASSVTSPVSDGLGTRYVVTGYTGTGSAPSGSGNSVSFTITEPSSVTWNWKTQYLLTFAQNGLESDASGTVVTIFGTDAKTIDQLPNSTWVDSGSLVAYNYSNIVRSSQEGKRFSLINVTGPESPITVAGPTNVTGNYAIQYQVTFSVSPTGSGETSPSGTDWYDAGKVLSISATPNPGYVFSHWSAIGTISITNPSSASTTATINGPGTITANFAPIPIVSITITSNPPGAGFIKVDDMLITTPATFDWTIGSTHKLEALSPVPGATGTRYVWMSWSDGGERIHNYTVPSSSETVTAYYKTQYYLTVLSPYGTPGGAGWYNAGEAAYATVTPLTVGGSPGTRYVFTHWSGDASGTTSPSEQIIMNAPKTAIANWKTQYYLKVLSDYGITYGEGWYDKGTMAYAGLDRGKVVLEKARHLFIQWTGDASGTNYATSNPIAMNAPKTAIAQWSSQFYLTLETNPPGIATPSGEGWYDKGTNASIGTPECIYSQDGTSRYVFCGWSTEAMEEIANSYNASSTVLMDKAKTVTANYRLQYLVTVTAFPSEALGGTFKVAYISLGRTYEALEPKVTPWTEWVDANITIALREPQEYVPSEDALGGIRYRFDTYDPSQNVTMDAPRTITLVYKTQYLVTFDQTGVGSDFEGYVVTIDEASYGSSELPKAFWWDEGSFHSFAYESELLVDTGKRYVWMNTTGLSGLREATMNVTAQGNITANYGTLYYLNVLSQYGNPYGSGWYPKGSEARFGVTTPVNHGNRTIRVFVRWFGDAQVYEPEGTIVMLKPSEVIASWQTQYLVTFNTTLPDRRILSVPRVPELRPPGMEVFGMYYPAGETVTVGPAPLIAPGAEGTRYIFEGWKLDGQPFTKDLNISLVVDRPYDVSIAYEIEHLLSIKALGVRDPFVAKVTITTLAPIIRNLTPVDPILEWMRHGTQTTLTVSTPNKIGHGEWAIFGEWSGDAMGRNRSLSFVMEAPRTLNATFFKVNPVAESIPYSMLSGVVCMVLSCLIARKRRKAKAQNQNQTQNQSQTQSQSQSQSQTQTQSQSQGQVLEKQPRQARKNSLPWAFGLMVSAVALIVAAIVSVTVASSYGINANELLDFTNWAVVFLAIEALVFLLATKFLTSWIHRERRSEEPMAK